MDILLYLIPAAISSVISLAIYLNLYTPLLIIFWLLSIILIVLGQILQDNLNIKIPIFQLNKKTLFILSIIFLPSLVRIINFNPNRSRGDDLMTSYFSAQFDFSEINFFSGIPQNKAQWVSQFPTPYFALQKIFFIFFGESLSTVQFSVIPYVIVISAMLFLISKMLFGFKTAAVTVMLYAFFAPSLYLETLGLHFISSTAFYLVFFYLIVLFGRDKKPVFALIGGIFCGFCYLFYISSFIALPILILFFAIQFIFTRNGSVFKNFLLSIFGFLIVLAPFITYNLTIDNYLFSRVDQVSLLTGSWSRVKDQIAQGSPIINFVKENADLAIKSLYLDDIGGHGGYDFGFLAFFEKFTFNLLLLGLTAGVSLLFIIKNKIGLFFILVTVAASFITGVILTIPPPAYHRFSLAFPFLAVIFSLPFNVLLNLIKKFKHALIFIILTLIAVYSVNNLRYFQKSVNSEFYYESIFVSDYINKHFPGRRIYVASFPGFGFDKVYYFSRDKNAKSVTTGYHSGFLENFNPGSEKYVYAIIFPDTFDNQFANLDSKGKIIKITKGYSLFVN